MTQAMLCIAKITLPEFPNIPNLHILRSDEGNTVAFSNLEFLHLHICKTKLVKLKKK